MDQIQTSLQESEHSGIATFAILAFSYALLFDKQKLLELADFFVNNARH